MTIRILLADDSQQYRALLRTMLDKQSDLQIVAEAGDGHAAMKEAVAQSADLVLMDVGMPQMDGIMATRLIHRAAAWRARASAVLALRAANRPGHGRSRRQRLRAEGRSVSRVAQGDT